MTIPIIIGVLALLLWGRFLVLRAAVDGMEKAEAERDKFYALAGAIVDDDRSPTEVVEFLEIVAGAITFNLVHWMLAWHALVRGWEKPPKNPPKRIMGMLVAAAQMPESLRSKFDDARLAILKSIAYQHPVIGRPIIWRLNLESAPSDDESNRALGDAAGLQIKLSHA